MDRYVYRWKIRIIIVSCVLVPVSFLGTVAGCAALMVAAAADQPLPHFDWGLMAVYVLVDAIFVLWLLRAIYNKYQ